MLLREADWADWTALRASEGCVETVPVPAVTAAAVAVVSGTLFRWLE